MWNEQRLHRRIFELRGRRELLEQKLKKLEQHSKFESNVIEQLRLEHKITEIKAERERVEQQLKNIENQLHQFKSQYEYFLELINNVWRYCVLKLASVFQRSEQPNDYTHLSVLQQKWDKLSEQLSNLERYKVFETRADEIFRLEHEITLKYNELQHIEQQLRDLEIQLFLFSTIYAYVKKILADGWEYCKSTIPVESGKSEKNSRLENNEITETNIEENVIAKIKAEHQQIKQEFSALKTKIHEGRLRQQADQLQQQWKLLNEKQSKLEHERILESRADEIFRLDHLIAEIKAERQYIEYHLDELETQLDVITKSNLDVVNQIESQVYISEEEYGISNKELDIAKKSYFTKAEPIIGQFDLEKQIEEIRVVKKFLLRAGFEIKNIANSKDFIAKPIIDYWKARFHMGIYVPAWFDNPLDLDTVISIHEKVKSYTNYALVVTKQQPKLDGWLGIKGMRCQETHPFILIPIAYDLIKEGSIAKKERRVFANYIEKYLGKGYNPYDVRDPVFDALSFFGREGIIDEILSELKLGKRVGLFGLHKIGKSSVLKTLEKKVDFPVAYVYLRKNMPLHDIYEDILKSWQDDLHNKYPDFSWNRDNLDSSPKTLFASAAKSLLKHLESVIPNPRLSIFLDEIETIVPYKEGDEDTLNCYIDLMDSLRGLQQETESISLLVAGVHSKIARVNYFWGSQKNPMHQIVVEKFLPPLERDDCEGMIRNLGKRIGLDYDDKTMDYIIRKSGAHPYLARQICSAAYQEHKEVGIMPFEIVQEAAEEFVYNPSRNDYFNDHALWGELAKEHLWGKEVAHVNHQILLKLADSEEGLSKAELSQGIPRVIFEQSFAALKERSIICLIPESDRYQITFELFQDWIQAHKLNRKDMSWQTHSISEHLFPTTNLSDAGIK